MSDFHFVPQLPAPGAPAEAPAGTQITNHTALAKARLVLQFQQPKIQTLTGCLVSNVQSMENALWQLFTERTVNNAIGAQLDVLGKLVGQARQGLDDTTYRRYIRARILANRSRGRTSDLIAVTRAVINDLTALVRVETQGVAAVVVRVEGGVALTPVVAVVAVFMLRIAHDAGIRCVFEWGESVQANLFQYDLGPGYDQGNYAGGADA